MRYCRLATVRSFVQHLLRRDVTRAGQYGRILAISNKIAVRRTAIYLEPEQGRAVIAAVDARGREGERDHALLLFLYNIGARVSEALAVRGSDLRLERPRQVRLLGKGQKERICPLWSETASALRRIISTAKGEDLLFRKMGHALHGWARQPDELQHSVCHSSPPPPAKAVGACTMLTLHSTLHVSHCSASLAEERPTTLSIPQSTRQLKCRGDQLQQPSMQSHGGERCPICW
jgi:integrase-like protein